MALVTVVEDGDLAESGPGYQAADKAAVFAAAAEMLHGQTVHQPEIPGVRGDVHVTEPTDDPVKEPGGKSLENVLPRSGSPLGKNNLVALLPFVDQLRDQLRGILQIGIDDNDGVAGGVIDARSSGHLMTKIPAEEDVLDVGVLSGQLGDDAAGFVGAAVVDEDKLITFGP